MKKKIRSSRGGKKRREGCRREAEGEISFTSIKCRSAVTAEVLQDSASLSSSSTSALSPSFFLQKAESCLQTFPPNFALSLKFLLKGVSVHPNDVTLLVRTAEALCEDGRLEEAKELLQRAIQIEPEGGDPGKYFCLAQIEEGEESLLLFQKASSLLSSKLLHLDTSINSVKTMAAKAEAAAENSSPSSATTASLRILEKEYREVSRQLVESKCSMAELYMTDLCELDQAETLCKKEIDEAVEIMEQKCNDSSSSSYIDALYLQASFRKTTGDISGAKDVGLKATRLIHEQLRRQENNLRIVPSKERESSSSSSLLHEEEEEEDVCSRELRINLSRVLIDVEEAESAAFLLSSCLEEDDGDPDIWLVLACALFKCDKLGEAEECLERLKQLVHASERISKSSKKKNQQNPLLLHAEELLRRIQEEKKKQIEAGELCEEGKEENEEEDDEEDNWEDEDEDNEDVDMGES